MGLGCVWLGRLAAVALLIFQVASGQEEKESLDRFIFVDKDQTVFYQQMLGSSNSNRIEYVGNPKLKSLLEIISTDGGSELHIQAYDYNRDFKTDLIAIFRYQHRGDMKNPQTISFYRGPERLKHSEWHVLHSLRHKFIQRDSTRAPALIEQLQALDTMHVNEEDIGFFTDYDKFKRFESPEIRKMFALFDSVFVGVKAVEFGDIRILRTTPGLATTYAVQIQELIKEDYFRVALYLKN